MKFTAVGDYLVQRRLPPDYDGFDKIRSWICRGETKYLNLETTLHYEGECYGFSTSGGSYLRMEPEVLDDCKRYGFNMLSFCNNHSLDFAYDGLIKTLEHVSRSGFVHAGAGMNLDQAAAPAYLETQGGRVALIGFTSSCNMICDNIGIAGRQSRRVKGRPGVNLLRVHETLFVTPEQMEQLRQIANQTQINAYEDILRREGYMPAEEEGTLSFSPSILLRAGEKPGKHSSCEPADLERAKQSIYEAKLQSDYIIIAIHSHQIHGNSKENPAQFLEEFAHFCIDAGADAIIGHGPHLLRPIEIYNGKPIFYSLGDFMLQNENIPFLPEDYFEQYGMTSSDTVHDLFKKRSNGFTRGLMSDSRMLESVIPYWEVENGKLTKLELLPIELTRGLPRSRVGLPRPAESDSILQRLQEMSRLYGVEMLIHDGIASVILDQ